MEPHQWQLIEFLLKLFIPIIGLVVFYFIGRGVERRHLKSLKERESALENIMLSELKTMPSNWQATPDEPVLVYGSVVVAIDNYKKFISALKKIVGGHLGEYERLLERGRREALIRMKTMAAERGCNVVWNLRIETAMLQDQGRRAVSAGSAEIHAYGTAMRVQ